MAEYSKDGKRCYVTVEKRCERCDKSFTVPAYRKESARFCSRICLLKGRGSRKQEEFEKIFWQGVDIKNDPNSCWLWLRAKTKKTGNWGGYGKGKYAGKYFLAHRVAYELANHTKAPAKLVEMHICDNPPCVNPNHLKLRTNRDNDLDKMAKGRHKPYRKLTIEQVKEIKLRLANGESSWQIAKDYPVIARTIRMIKEERVWKSI